MRSNGREYSISVEDIICCRAVGNFTELKTVHGKTHFYGQGLGKLDMELPDQFIRVHKSHIVNIECIVEICIRQGSRYSILAKDGAEIPLSRSRVSMLRARLK